MLTFRSTAELLRSTELRLVGVIALATGLAEAAMVFLPSFAVTGLRVPETTASFMMIPLVLALTVGAPAAGAGAGIWMRERTCWTTSALTRP